MRQLNVADLTAVITVIVGPIMGFSVGVDKNMKWWIIAALTLIGTGLGYFLAKQFNRLAYSILHVKTKNKIIEISLALSYIFFLPIVSITVTASIVLWLSVYLVKYIE